jgi:hypothetical protein
MKLWTKIGIGAGLAIAGLTYAMRMNRANAELVSMASAKIHKLDATGITFRVDLQLKNPTQQKLKIKYPFIKLLLKGTVIGTSQSVNKDIVIPAFGQVIVDKIMINVPLSGLFSIGMDVFKSIKDGRELKLTVTTISTIDLLFKKIPYTYPQEVTILKKDQLKSKIKNKALVPPSSVEQKDTDEQLDNSNYV